MQNGTVFAAQPPKLHAGKIVRPNVSFDPYLTKYRDDFQSRPPPAGPNFYNVERSIGQVYGGTTIPTGHFGRQVTTYDDEFGSMACKGALAVGKARRGSLDNTASFSKPESYQDRTGRLADEIQKTEAELRSMSGRAYKPQSEYQDNFYGIQHGTYPATTQLYEKTKRYASKSPMVAFSEQFQSGEQPSSSGYVADDVAANFNRRTAHSKHSIPNGIIPTSVSKGKSASRYVDRLFPPSTRLDTTYGSTFGRMGAKFLAKSRGTVPKFQSPPQSCPQPINRTSEVSASYDDVTSKLNDLKYYDANLLNPNPATLQPPQRPQSAAICTPIVPTGPSAGYSLPPPMAPVRLPVSRQSDYRIPPNDSGNMSNEFVNTNDLAKVDELLREANVLTSDIRRDMGFHPA